MNRVKLGTQEFHAFDFIGDMNGSKTIIFANKQTTLVEMEIDFAFRYGLFGYGFGSQVEQKQLDQKYIFSQSIFPKVPVPGFRKDSDFVCEPIHVDYPDFINLEERSYIGSDPVRRQANKFTQDQMNDGGHILNIKLNPLTSRSYESLGPQSGASQESVNSSLLKNGDFPSALPEKCGFSKFWNRSLGPQSGASQESVNSSLFDEDNQYIVSQSKQAKFLMDVMNRRKRLPGIIGKYACKRTRYERLKYLETVIAKRGEIIGSGTMNNNMGKTMGIDERNAEELTYAEILMQMAPGVNTRKRDSDVKTSPSKLLGSFKNIGLAIGRASNLFTKGSRLNLTSSKMSLGGNRSKTNKNTVQESQGSKNTSAKNSFGFIEEEDEYVPDQWRLHTSL
jgi:hypothetical protein